MEQEQVQIDSVHALTPLPPLQMILNNIASLNAGEPIGLLRLLELNDGIIPDDWEQLYAVLSKKVDNIGMALAIHQGEIDAIKEFKEAVQAKIKSKENDLKNFKSFLHKIVDKFGDIEGKGEKAAKWLRGEIVGIKKTESIEISILDDKFLPNDYILVQVELTPAQYEQTKLKCAKNKELLSALSFHKIIVDQTKIKQDLLADERKEIPGVQKVDKKTVAVYGNKKTIKTSLTKTEA